MRYFLYTLCILYTVYYTIPRHCTTRVPTKLYAIVTLPLLRYVLIVIIKDIVLGIVICSIDRE